MEDMSEAALHNLRDQKHLSPVISKALGLEQLVENFKNQVHQILEGMKKEVHDLHHKDSSQALQRTYEPIRKRVLDIHSQVLQWEMDNLLDDDKVRSNAVVVKEKLLGSGNAMAFYAGTRQERQHAAAVVVKRYLIADSVRIILQEYKWLK